MISKEIWSKLLKALSCICSNPPLTLLRHKFRIRVDLKLAHKAVLLVSVPLIFEIIFVLGLAVMLNQAEREVSKEVQARTIIYHVSNINISLMEASGSVAGYSISKSSRFIQVFHDAVAAISSDLRSLRQIHKVTPAQYAAYLKYSNLVSSLIDHLTKSLHLLERDDELAGLAELEAGKQVQEILRGKAALMLLEQEKIIRTSPVVRIRARQQLRDVLLAGVVFNIVLAFGLAAYFNRDIISRLSILMDNTNKLARQEKLNPPLNGRDEIAYLDKVFHDMAFALAEAARKERAMVENAQDVIFSLDATGKFTRVSAASLKLWGYKPEELIGLNYTDVMADESGEKNLHKARASLDGIPFESGVRKKDGTIAHMLWSSVWSPSESSLFCVGHDITERHQIEQMKQEFLSMVSHDLRSPLTSIQAFLTMLNEGIYGSLTERGLEKAASADRSTQRLLRLVNDLLDLDKLDSGLFELKVTTMHLLPVIVRSVDALRALADSKGITIETPITDVEVMADEDRLEQVIVNLLSNAIKYSPPSRPVAVAVQGNGDWVEVQIADKGRGIPLQQRKSIFERFKQIEISDHKEQGGSGLGLAIAKALIEKHGGVIGVDSKEGEGSTFWFKLPVARRG